MRYVQRKNEEVKHGFKIFTSYEILPHQFSIPFSLGFIAIEVISSLLIIFRFHAVIGIIMLGILTFIYTLAILINLLRGRKDLSCGNVSCIPD
ncbi:MauE/DoxX family redox-associated membrane protein [Virgibacillus sp. JSM 102003]|uniref:MauE/DoxX family redox-associated membrane protein n=1 Tax=Virgibacillus sp. JSM 102003 TaxID=1562108 RepID=UPI0035C02755